MSEELSDILEEHELDARARATMERLGAGRPLPSPAFRGALARLISATPLPRSISHRRPKALALAVAGALLLAVAGAGVAGEGPLAPGHTAAAKASAASTSR